MYDVEATICMQMLRVMAYVCVFVTYCTGSTVSFFRGIITQFKLANCDFIGTNHVLSSQNDLQSLFVHPQRLLVNETAMRANAPTGSWVE